VDDPTLIRRLTEIETQLELVSERVGVPWSRPGASLPAEVRDLARAGKKIDAIRLLCQLRGLSLIEAKRAVDDL